KSTLTNSLVAAASVIGQEVDGDASMTNTCDDEPRCRRTIKSTAYMFSNPLLDKKLMFLNPCIYVFEPVHICSRTRAHMFSERALSIVSFYTISLTTYQVPQQIHLHI
ncbi:hypothetical protein Tco_1527375, partial [Tanacetum coccineum]